MNFRFVKSNYFRIVHVNGAFGGLTPHGELFISMYNEHAPIPSATVQKIEPDGKLGDEVQRIGDNAIERELEVGLVMSLDAARNIASWLQQKVDLAQKIQAEISRSAEVTT
jgi:hypothetical protein